MVLCLLVGSIAGQQSRRIGVRVRPTVQEEVSQEESDFYDGQPEQQQQVLIRQPTLGRAIASQPRIQSTIGARQKTANEERPAPVQTIRNYNKLNDDGSFTFGYEAADGSFKEETRGTDCVVRGKYGYIDPDGNKREFTYVSGNPCDPNAEKQEQEEEPAEAPVGSAEENVPANYPQRPLKASRRPSPPERPSTTLFQQQFATQEAIAADEEEEQQQVNIRPRPTIRPTQFTTVQQEPQVFRQSSPAPRPGPTFAPQPSRPTVRFEQPPATTFRPQIQLTTSSPLPARSQAPSAGPKPSGGLDFTSEFKKFQIDLDELNPSRAPKPSSGPVSQGGSSALYQTELVFDPATGQYNTVVYQQVPKTAESPAPQRFAPPPQPQPQFFSPPRQAFSQPPPSAFQQQQLFQQQQSALQVQQSQQLFEQQQEQKRATEAPPRIPHTLLRQSPQTFSSPSTPAPQRFQPEPTPQRFLSEAPSQRFNPSSARSQRFPSEPAQPQRFSQPSSQQSPQPFFFVAAPSDRQTFASGQIDTFLRGHNLQF
ncbi:hypothetical protein WDU94_004941 [Cyamophila willieti]